MTIFRWMFPSVWFSMEIVGADMVGCASGSGACEDPTRSGWEPELEEEFWEEEMVPEEGAS